MMMAMEFISHSLRSLGCHSRTKDTSVEHGKGRTIFNTIAPRNGAALDIGPCLGAPGASMLMVLWPRDDGLYTLITDACVQGLLSETGTGIRASSCQEIVIQ